MQEAEGKKTILGFAGWSGSGKTTLIVRLIPELRKKGFRKVAVIKHNGHGREEKVSDVTLPQAGEPAGADTQRFREAGTSKVILCISQAPSVNYEKAGRRITETEGLLSKALEMAKDADLILVEGFKHTQIPRIGLCRRACEKGFTGPLTEFEAVVTDLLPEDIFVEDQPTEEKRADSSLQLFHPDEIGKIAAFIRQFADDL